MFDASRSKQLQVLRAAIVLAMVARAGTVYAHDGEESDAFAKAIVSASDEVNYLAGHIAIDGKRWPSTPSADGQEKTNCVLPAKGDDDTPVVDTPKPGKPKPDRQDKTAAEIAAEQAKVSAVAAQASAEAAERFAQAAKVSKADADKAAQASQNAAQEAVAAALAQADPQRVAAAAAAAVSASKPKDCQVFAVNFESDMPLMERALFRVTIMALPQDLAKNFINSLTGVNLLAAVWDGAQLALAAMDGLHNAAAVNRTAIEIEAHQSRRAACKAGQIKTVDGAFDCLGLSHDYAFVAAPDADYAPDVDARAFEALMLNIEQSCMMLPLNTGKLKDDREKTVHELSDERMELCRQIKFDPKPRFVF